MKEFCERDAKFPDIWLEIRIFKIIILLEFYDYFVTMKRKWWKEWENNRRPKKKKLKLKWRKNSEKKENKHVRKVKKIKDRHKSIEMR